MKPTFDIAAEMDRLLQSEDNKKAGGYSEQMQKLAFVRVADEDQIGEIEAAMLAATEPKKEDLVQKLASEKCCECNPANKHECKCTCHTENKKEASVKAPINKVAVMVDTLLVLSETLEDEGFEKLAAYSIVLADKLVSEAKAKKSKSKSKSTEKSKAEKAKAKAKADKEKASKSKSKSSKKTAQVHPWEQRIEPGKQAPKNEAGIIMEAVKANPALAKMVSNVDVQGAEVRVSCAGQLSQQCIDGVLGVVQKLQQAGKLQNFRPYRVVPA